MMTTSALSGTDGVSIGSLWLSGTVASCLRTPVGLRCGNRALYFDQFFSKYIKFNTQDNSQAAFDVQLSAFSEIWKITLFYFS